MGWACIQRYLVVGRALYSVEGVGAEGEKDLFRSDGSKGE